MPRAEKSEAARKIEITAGLRALTGICGPSTALYIIRIQLHPALHTSGGIIGDSNYRRKRSHSRILTRSGGVISGFKCENPG